MENIRTYADENVVIALVANKADVLHVNQSKREVPREAADKFARENDLIFVGETTALGNENITEVMEALLEKVFNTQKELINKGKKQRDKVMLNDEGDPVENTKCCYWVGSGRLS